jgi:hypothetical protein
LGEEDMCMRHPSIGYDRELEEKKKAKAGIFRSHSDYSLMKEEDKKKKNPTKMEMNYSWN